MSQSWATIPHFYTFITVDMSRAVERQAELGKDYTCTDLIAQATARSLARYPALNGHWNEGGPALSVDIHLGLVVETERGLVIPTLRDLQDRNLHEIAAARAKLVRQALAGNMGAQAMTAATFTLSNIGSGHIDHFTAIINPPQLAILTMGSILPRALVVDDELVVRPTATFSVGVDHRAIDGRTAAGFLESLKSTLEQEAGDE